MSPHLPDDLITVSRTTQIADPLQERIVRHCFDDDQTTIFLIKLDFGSIINPVKCGPPVG